MQNKETNLKYAVQLFGYLFVVWGFYRLLVQLPETIEELLIKPVVWLIPLIYILRKERLGLSSLGVSSDNLFKSVYLALILGSVFAIEAVGINFVKYGKLEFNANLGENLFLVAFILSVATAITEEIVFRGYIFNRVWMALDREWSANFITSCGWGLVHMPVAIFDWKLDIVSLFIYFILTFAFAVGSSFVFARSRNIISPILLHILWQWPIILFR
ncbi:MAG: hypothetical protein UV74_C0001G0011 [Candidatus Woesebacteria bacterium GW2011_GWB1_43_14]|uniref:CAAX prenyl protease 2/Lysostaphin resistance protein A-like domain-containing protein n=1 Tax=Candidatus Woesebacteria bacterium GW2011_GWB1_43_14 TaxID=1618578 RepID=A0A0G1FV78_9BACT|nr:MAG: hypothetical protein UV51_C0011G0010 [Candidatus Woesebacteria bacterium GW2011_GWC1_42_9]KKS98901.1 MAG: hypothetical protein UV74_C0001G0011 [Candidatus Woesebacteria bacterium GW2011_GWB1_43_14]